MILRPIPPRTLNRRKPKFLEENSTCELPHRGKRPLGHPHRPESANPMRGSYRVPIVRSSMRAASIHSKRKTRFISSRPPSSFHIAGVEETSTSGAWVLGLSRCLRPFRRISSWGRFPFETFLRRLLAISCSMASSSAESIPCPALSAPASFTYLRS